MMMKHKGKLILLISLTVVLIFALVFVAIRIVDSSNASVPTEHMEPDHTDVILVETLATEPLETTAPDASELVTEPATEPPTEATEPTEPVVQQPKPPTPGVEKPTYIRFPYTVPSSDLEIQNIMSYDGIFLEDGSNRDVTGISAMILVNRGKKAVEYVEINLVQDGRKLKFTATDIPGNSTIVIQEAAGSAYSTSGYSDITSNVAMMDKLEMSESQVRVEELDDGSLRVTNLTNQTIPCVRIFYKFALEKGKIYVGGITYASKITNLGAGETVTVTPSHYAPGSSEVMMVRTYATAD